jgi:hypothetical protein
MRAIERTSRFKRDYRREKSGVLSKKLDHFSSRQSVCWRPTGRCRSGISITRYRESGAAFATVTSGRIWC